MKKKIMIIGPSGSGKTTLCHYLNGEEKAVRKTQDIIFGKHTIDVPGSYLDNPGMYEHLIAVAQNHASQIVCLVDINELRDRYPPEFTKVFNCPVTGVITKYDGDETKAEKCEKQLSRAGIKTPRFRINKDEEAGMERLKEYLFRSTLNGGEHEIYHRI